ncbi:cytochrome P450 [Mycena epipterygia]|nr:cytochrome P450 [Mycena epipterygia]
MLFLNLHWTLGSIFTLAAAIILAGLLFPYFRDPYRIRKYPGPVLAKFTYAWLLWAGITRRRSQIIHEMHKKYGPIIRISPSEISFSSPVAHSEIYSFNSQVTKSAFYNAFASIGLTNVFTARSKSEHGQKRKLLHPLFTGQVARQFSLRTSLIISSLLDDWATRYASEDGSKWFDCAPWISFLAFDEMGDFIFGEPFGMVASVSDSVAAPRNAQMALSQSDPSKEYPLETISLADIVSKRETYNYFVGVLPPWWKGFGRRILRRQVEASSIFSGTISAESKNPSTSSFCSSAAYLTEFWKRETFRRESLISELITILVAGSDTTRNSLIAAVYYLAKSPEAQSSLQRELDAHMTSATTGVSEIEELPFLGACLNETLRLYSPVPIGLPRTVPKAGMRICGETFVSGTTVGAPIYTIHRDESVWGDAPEEFRPERWLEENAKTNINAFKPFSDGPASCIGKTLALVQLRVMIAAIFKRFDVFLEHSESPLHIEDWFVRRAIECRIGIRLRPLERDGTHGTSSQGI